MKTSKEVLSSILKTTQMGQTGIRSVMDYTVGVNLRRELQSQLHEYDAIEAEAHRIARQQGWQVPELSKGVRVMSDMMSRSMLAVERKDSKIAGMMITGNTRGMIKSIKNQHHSPNIDASVRTLNQKLIDRETENIRSMEPYL